MIVNEISILFTENPFLCYLTKNTTFDGCGRGGKDGEKHFAIPCT